MSDAIILFSHGSLLCGAGENLGGLAQRMRERGDAPLVEVGYLNYSEPPFEEAFANCVAQDATRIIVAPYFLVAGYFVTKTLAPKIAAMQAQYPDVEVRLAEAMRFHPSLAEAVLACAARAAAPETWRGLLSTAPLFCRADSQCPLYGSEQCPATGKNLTLQGRDLTTLPPHDLTTSLATALLVMAHGSPQPESNDDLFAVVDLVRQCGIYHAVRAGFLECNAPLIPAALEACVAEGAQRIIAVPYFLHAGNHVAADLPALLEEAQAKYPHLEFLMGDYLGHDVLIADVVRDRVAGALELSS
ncbi:MAG TPA: CbiX/SirB N-terminal domain-containing protein, partial [Abditibacteriaceae bacterium]|nr:CbiX/SirB N-terminal domain-containing protein [Abditibacteriaceae bacterium]